MVEEGDGLCHIQEGFIPTDIHLSSIHIAPAFKPGESIRKTPGFQSNLFNIEVRSVVA